MTSYSVLEQRFTQNGLFLISRKTPGLATEARNKSGLFFGVKKEVETATEAEDSTVIAGERLIGEGEPISFFP